MDSVRTQARIAGVLYFLLAASAPLGLIYVPNKLFVAGNAAATAEHIRVAESLLRMGIGSELLHQVIGVFLVLALYKLFRPVNQALAQQLTILGLLPTPIVFLNVLNEIAALILTSGADFLSVYSKPQLDALAMFFIRLHQQGIQVAAIFWGLWLFPFGLLVIRSGFIPRFLGVLLLLAGLGYLFNATVALIFPHSAGALVDLASILELGEPPIILWLLIWGARARASRTGTAGLAV